MSKCEGCEGCEEVRVFKPGCKKTQEWIVGESERGRIRELDCCR